MNPYILTAIIFSVILGGVYMFVQWPRTIYLPNMNENSTESIETRKERAQKIRSRQFVIGIGGTIGLCLLTMLVIAVSGPVKKVQAALYPSATPTVTNTHVPTRTPTPRPTRTPTATSATGGDNFLTTIAGTPGSPQSGRGTPTATLKPSFLQPSTGGGGGVTTITIVQTRIVNQVHTQIVYQPVYMTQIVNVPVTVIVIWTPTYTPTPLPTAIVETVTPTFTSTPEPATLTPTVEFTPTETIVLGTPTP